MRHDLLIPEFVEYMPEEIREGIIYVSQKYETAIHLCACGCGRKVVTPTGDSWWSITINDGKVTLNPSIGNWQLPCKTHYFIRDNRIEWC